MTIASIRTVLIPVFLLVIAVGAVAAPITGEEAGTVEKSADEHGINASFLYNFAKYIKWPDSAFEDEKSPVTVFIIGDGLKRESLESLNGKMVGKRNVVIKEIDPQSISKEDRKACHILFISETDTISFKNILSVFENRNVLTVSDIPGFSLNGGMIELYRDRNSTKFTINIDAVNREALQISSRLLRLAKIVKDPA